MLSGLPDDTTYAELLEYLKRDLRLDASTDVLSATVTQENLATGRRGMLAEAFSVYNAVGFGITSLAPFTWDTVPLNSSNRLTNTNGRFTPKVPGWYRFGSYIYINDALTATQIIGATLLKNGVVTNGQTLQGPVSAGNASVLLNASVLANGTTDYFEYALTHNVSPLPTLTAGLANNNWFGYLIGKT